MKNKVVVITGASKGLGKAMAEILVAKGALVAISSRGKEELKKVASEIGVTAIVADVTKEKDVIALAQKAIKKFGKIDIWINNAGLWLPRAPVEETNIKRAHELMEVNLFGTIYGSREALLQMKKQGYGMIVNIVSTSALAGRPNQTIYSASKHAARGFTDSLREEVIDQGIKVIGIYPGGIKTHLFDGHKPEDFADFMEPEYVARKIIENLEKENPESEMILKRPGQVLTK